jgi:hypothetical protein
MSKFRISQDAAHRLTQWMFSDDTGVSSETMAAVAMGVKKKDSFGNSPPWDSYDFGRCHRLLQAVPEVREVFPEIAKLSPVFAALIEQWDELSAIYVAGLPDKWNKKLNARLDGLRDTIAAE